MKRALPLFVIIVLACLFVAPEGKAQQTPQGRTQQTPQVPSSARRGLAQQGMTPQEAAAEAERLGIDLSEPQVALQQARMLGIPESTIRELLDAVNRPQFMTDSLMVVRRRDRRPPQIDGVPRVDPATLAVPEEGDTVAVDFLVSDDASGLDTLDLYLVGPTRQDTTWAEWIELVDGDSLEGTWHGRFFIPFETRQGLWTLFAYTRDLAGNESDFDTGATLRVVRSTALAEEEAEADSLEYFGYSTFQNVPMAFQAGVGGPVSNSYVVGPEDELRLIVWGAAEFQYDLTVDREGRITVPRVGQLTVAGRRLEELRQEMREWLSHSYAGLTDDPPSVFMDLTVTRLRPVQVFVLGEVEQPGGYTLSAGATIFSALYATGGPLTRGSLRNIQIIRGDRVTTVDMYNYLLRGYDPNPVQLQSGDHIFIPPRGTTVAIEGAVRRPAIYELREEETFEDLLAFSGGLEPEAYTKRYQIERIVPFGLRTDPAVSRTVLDMNLSEVLSEQREVPMEDGDHVTIFSILEQESTAAQSRISSATVAGAVYQPGRYELGAGVRTLRDLIEEADGLTGAAFRGRADLIRLNQKLEREIVSVDLEGVMQDVPTENLVLRPSDSLYVYAAAELQAEQSVRISGQILNPGAYELLDGMTVGDLLFRGGGLRDTTFIKNVFLARADLFRRSRDGHSETIIPFDLREALQGRGFAAEQLQPEDEIRIYPVEVRPDVVRDRFVTISGAVKKPGRYRYRDGMTLEDVILQAEGFEENAYMEEAEVTRTLSDRENESDLATQIRVPLNVSGMLASTGSLVADSAASIFSAASTFQLKHRDQVFIRPDPGFREQEIVTVRGDVRFPGEYALLHENETLAQVIDRAGGVLPTGYIGGGQLLREGQKVIVDMEEAVEGDSRFNVVLQPGDEVVIPPRPNTVAVRGNVANEGLIKFVPGKRLDYYLERAGGRLDRTEAIYLTQASGATFRIRRGIMGRSPVVEEGATIQVTRKPPPTGDGNSVDIGRTITDVIGILSSTFTVVVLARQALR